MINIYQYVLQNVEQESSTDLVPDDMRSKIRISKVIDNNPSMSCSYKSTALLSPSITFFKTKTFLLPLKGLYFANKKYLDAEI